MNRGNLAEDPRVDRPSSSRYSRYGSESNALLYVSDREWKRALAEKNASSAGQKKESRGTGRQDNRVKNSRGVSAKTAAGTGFRLEVGMHGRLFGVQEKQTVSQTDAQADADAARRQDLNIQNASEVFHTRKPARPYLDAPNPLLERKNMTYGRTRRQHGKKAVSTAEPAAAAPAANVQAEMSASVTGRPAAAMPMAASAAKTREVSSAAAVAAPMPASADRHISVRKMLIAAGAGVLAAGYISAGVHFSDHFYPGTEFFGIDASGQTVSEVKRLVADKVAGYTLTIHGRSSSGATAGMTDTVTADQIGLQYRDNGMIDREMKDQYSALWPVFMLKSVLTDNRATLGTKYDADMADAVIDGLSVFDKSRITAPKDAELKFSDDGAYVSHEVMGTTLDHDKAKQAILTALNDGSTQLDLEKENLYQNPTVFSDDDALNEKADALNKVLGASFTIDIGDQSVTCDPEKISEEFLSMDMDGNYYVDADKIVAFTNDLAQATDTVGIDRTFRTSLGTTVDLSGGDYGWTMDAEETADEIRDYIDGKKKGNLEPVYSVSGLCRDKDDIGDSYVEINLTNQHMWFYKNGSLIVDTPVVTGNPLKNNETPYGGVWSLKGKYQKATLKGQGYATPVDYWMPFNGGVGIHDLQARYYFGGTVYNGAGSHGCINTPLAAVSLIYHYIDTGTPVIVYKDESEAAVSQNTGMQDIGSITAYIQSTYGTVSNDASSQGTDSGAGQVFETAQAAVDNVDEAESDAAYQAVSQASSGQASSSGAVSQASSGQTASTGNTSSGSADGLEVQR